MRVRVARTSDAASIAAIHVDSWRWAYESILPTAWLDQLDRRALTRRWARRILQLTRTRSGGWVTVVEDRAEVIGFAIFGPDLSDPDLYGLAADVQMLYVRPEHVGRGAGRKLFGHALETLADDGWKWVVVWVLEANERARAFYGDAGLRVDGARRLDRIGGSEVRVVRYAAALDPVVDWDTLRSEIVGRRR